MSIKTDALIVLTIAKDAHVWVAEGTYLGKEKLDAGFAQVMMTNGEMSVRIDLDITHVKRLAAMLEAHYFDYDVVLHSPPCKVCPEGHCPYAQLEEEVCGTKGGVS